MASTKEMFILFVYDLEYCRNEHDDPLLAIKYFHPSWVSDMQKMALCGQLMGLLNFCKDFENPEILSLQNGMFKIHRFGRFIFSIGTDRNIQESLLKQRAELMVNILQLYHRDIETLFLKLSNEQKSFSDKLYHIFETFLPLLTHNGNLLQNVYKLFLPKSASNLYLDGQQILEHIANKPGIHGGMILHVGKVLASQFSTDLTKVLTATDPLKIKTTGEFEKHENFHFANHQIIKVYIKSSEFKRLQKHKRKVEDSTTLSLQNHQPLPFSIRKMSKEPLKRDKSFVFPNIPEEEPLNEVSSVEKIRKRPNHLPLKFKTMQSKELPESGIASIISFDESDSYADFIGRTSVCATPMTENKVLAGPLPSMFAAMKPLDVKKPEVVEENAKVISDSAKPPEKELEQIPINLELNPYNVIQWKRMSFCEINTIADESPFEFSPRKNVYYTITDPVFPIFGQKMQPLSRSLLDDYQNLNVTNANFFKPPKEDKPEHSSKPEKKKINTDTNDAPNVKPPGSPFKASQNQKKKMMRLPIKSFSLDTVDSEKSSTSAQVAAESIKPSVDSPSSKSKKYMANLQLTPLMTKLTILAMSENENLTSNFSSFDLLSPTAYCDTPIDNTHRSVVNRLTKVDEEKKRIEVKENSETSEMKRVDLFVCGQQNMTLLLLTDENLMNSDKQFMQSMFDICVNRLSRLEQKLNEIINVAGDLKAGDYSFMNLDKQWDIIKRGGVWQQEDLQSVLLMHDHFANESISDVIIRTSDSVLYGHNKSGESEIYYQHSSQKQSSGILPAPSDFTIISQAKRRLERDHSLVLF